MGNATQRNKKTPRHFIDADPIHAVGPQRRGATSPTHTACCESPAVASPRVGGRTTSGLWRFKALRNGVGPGGEAADGDATASVTASHSASLQGPRRRTLQPAAAAAVAASNALTRAGAWEPVQGRKWPGGREGEEIDLIWRVDQAADAAIPVSVLVLQVLVQSGSVLQGVAPIGAQRSPFTDR